MKLKVPPPLVALIIVLAMWGLARITDFSSVLALVYLPWWLPWLFIAFAVALDVFALTYFRSAKTTMNPMRPKNASQLVTSGIYRYTRNPMYLGLFCILTAFVIWFESPLNFGLLFVYVIYMNQFQIAPEEAALTELFGDEYEQYKSNVRRWL